MNAFECRPDFTCFICMLAFCSSSTKPTKNSLFGKIGVVDLHNRAEQKKERLIYQRGYQYTRKDDQFDRLFIDSRMFCMRDAARCG